MSYSPKLQYHNPFLWYTHLDLQALQELCGGGIGRRALFRGTKFAAGVSTDKVLRGTPKGERWIGGGIMRQMGASAHSKSTA